MAETVRDRSIGKADPDPTSVTATNSPTTYAPLVAPQNKFVAEPLDTFRDADLELDDMEICTADSGLKASRRRE